MSQNQMDLDAGAGKLCGEYGVFGICNFDRNDVASTIYYGLFTLQHRGQESCGVAVSDTQGPKEKVGTHKSIGFCNEIFTVEILEQMHGNIGVGHARYSTVGGNTRENTQLLMLNYIEGTLTLAHNGNPINAPWLRHELEYMGVIFQTAINSEVTAYHIAGARMNTLSAKNAVSLTMKKLKGAYSLMIMSPRKLIGARDPFGFRPLRIGRRDNVYILASETCVLSTIGAEFVRDMEPREVVIITKGRTVSNREMCPKGPAREVRCIFKYAYFVRPDSVSGGVSVYHAKIQTGRFLAMDAPVEADLVIGVPESGNDTAPGYSMEPGVPYGAAFVKNSYVKRTLIKPKRSSREPAVRIKLSVFKEAAIGKRVITTDDPIVRGMTSALIVGVLRDTGAIQVRMRVSAPPFLYPCYFNAGIPPEDQLTIHGHTVDEIRRIIGADSLSFLQTERLHEMVTGKPVCMACFSGAYPVEPPSTDIRGTYEKQITVEYRPLL